MKLTSTPAADGYRLPAAFEPNRAGYMIWPQRPDNWREGGKPVQRSFVKLAELLARDEFITMLVNQNQYQNARAMLPDSVRVIEMSNDDAFIKDTGPFYLVNAAEDLRAADFNFNAWGGLLDGLYFPWDKDNQIAQKLADLDGIDFYKHQRVLEGCSVMVDGEGTLITTEEVILSEGRNKSASKAEAEQVFKDYFGAEKVLWLPEGFFLDEAGGDIDNMVSFVRPGEIVLSWTDDKTDPQYEISHAAFDKLVGMTDAKGRKLKIHRLQIPSQLLLTADEANGVDPINGMLPRVTNQRLTATYVNYITTNRSVIVPTFDDPQDEVALAQFRALYPDRQVIGFPTREILTGGGGLHTILLNVPGK
ncbi:agmatine deiminase [Secundilactobacillus similis]|uniref:Putative agmatine deiminase n=1 Tax=Secundilactobacillus similis DSM 23365 = JCM 2765 TaxID=1423804 RepID=A0A0R2FLL6_9LACO|nr:agmatine deiminase [Secundilactobacillus similis]KRN25738.1 peptidylarginine deiminase-like protein [Secundilactobacillus similis DSM 23365 = JCM 2765]